MFGCKIRKNIVQQIVTFRCQRQFLHKDGKGVNKMTQPDLILKLVEQLLAEREENIKLQSQLEEYKKSKDQNVSYIVEYGELLWWFSYFLFLDIKKVCVLWYTYGKQYTQA